MEKNKEKCKKCKNELTIIDDLYICETCHTIRTINLNAIKEFIKNNSKLYEGVEEELHNLEQKNITNPNLLTELEIKKIESWRTYNDLLLEINIYLESGSDENFIINKIEENLYKFYKIVNKIKEIK